MQVGMLHKNCAAQQASAWILHSCTSCVTCEKGLLPGIQAHSLKKTHFSCVDYLPIPATGAKPTRSERLLPVEPGQHSATNRCKLENVETKWVQSARNACQWMFNRKRSFHTIARCCALRPVVLVTRITETPMSVSLLSRPAWSTKHKRWCWTYSGDAFSRKPRAC